MGLKKGASLTTPTAMRVLAIARIRKRLVEECSLKCPGADRIISEAQAEGLEFCLKRDAVKRIVKRLKGGEAAEDIASAPQQKRGRPESKARTDGLVAKVKADLAAAPSSVANSHRQLAQRYKVSKGVIHRVLKNDVKVRALRKVKTTSTTEKKRQARKKACNEIAEGLESSKYESDWIFYSDESRFDTTGNRYNESTNKRQPKCVRKP